MVHDALSVGLQVLGDVTVGENSWDEEFVQAKEERNRFLEGVNYYNREKEVVMKAVTWSLVDLEEKVNFLETEDSLLMKLNKKLTSCSI